MSHHDDSLAPNARRPRIHAAPVFVLAGASTVLVGAAIMLASASAHYPETITLWARQEQPTDFSNTLQRPALKKRDIDVSEVLEHRIPQFFARNSSLSYIVFALNTIGVDVCHEAARGRQSDWYLDTDGNAVFRADRIMSIELRDCRVRDIMDRIVGEDGAYVWTAVAGTRLINLVPKQSSLRVEVGPFAQVGKPYDLLGEMLYGKSADGSELGSLGLKLARGAERGGTWPDVRVKFARCTVRDALNAIVRGHSGMSWHYKSGAYFQHMFPPTAHAVSIDFGNIRIGRPTNSKARYVIRERKIDGRSTVVIEKESISRP